MFSLQTMTEGDLDQVLAIEQRSQSEPWTRGHFSDSMAAGYECQTLRRGDELIAYYVAMSVLDESHLLTLSVIPEQRRQGVAEYLLEQWALTSVASGRGKLWLEVRLGNAAAIALYAKHGFTEVARRKNYYAVNADQREDAIVMARDL